MAETGKTWNPFTDADDVSPFSDPSIQEARSSQGHMSSLDEYNPFDDKKTTTTSAASVKPSFHENPPPYTESAAQPASLNLQLEQNDLERKADALQRQEIELQRQIVLTSISRNNFPPLPSWCPFKPCFYQDINVEIPQQFQKLVRLVFYLWLAYSILLVINTISLLACFIVWSECGITFGVSLIHLFLAPPLSFFCWFRTLYRAFRNDSSLCFFWFFFILFKQFIYAVLFCIGFINYGTCGWLIAFALFGGNRTQKCVGALIACVASLFTVFAILLIVALIKVNKAYRSSGASFKKAQEELAAGVASNRTVQQTAAGMGSSVINGAVDGAVNNMTVTNKY